MNIGRKTKYGTMPSVIIAIVIVAMLTVGPILSSTVEATFQLLKRDDGTTGGVITGFSQTHIASTSQSAIRMELTTVAQVSPLDIARAVVVGMLDPAMLNRPGTVTIDPGSNPISAVPDGTGAPLTLNDIASLSVKVFAELQTAGSGGVTPSFEIVLKQGTNDVVQIAVQVCPMDGGGLGDCSQTDMYINGNSANGRATATANLNVFGTMSPAATTDFAGSRWEMFDVNALGGVNAPAGSTVHPDDGEVHTLTDWKAGSGTNAAIGTLEVTSISVLFHAGNPAGIPIGSSSVVWIDDIVINGATFHPQSAASFGGESTASFTPRITPIATSSNTD